MLLVATLTVLLTVLAARILLPSAGPPRFHAARGPGGPQAFVTVDPARPGRPVPPGFLGLSFEWDTLRAYAGRDGRRAAALRRLLEPLRRGRQPPALRIGGDTADQAWWNPGHRNARPDTVLQDITPATLVDVRRLARAVGGPVTLNLNLALGRPHNNLALARAAVRGLPGGTLDTLEIGNEPDLYTSGHTFHVPGHRHRRVRKHGVYGIPAYRRDVARQLDVLAGHVGAPVRFAVAGFAAPGWWRAMPRLLDGWGSRADALSAHLYALPQCSAPTPPAAWLMSAEASRGRVRSLAGALRVARQRDLPLRVTELNSAACGGRRHLSDTSAGALWLADTLFALVQHGADGADVHTWDRAHYAPFAPSGRAMVARPPLAGMLAFARATPAGSRLVGLRQRGSSVVHAWATRDGSGEVRVLLIVPRAVRAYVTVARRRCLEVWTATGRRQVLSRACRGRRRLVLRLPARSLAVVRLGR